MNLKCLTTFSLYSLPEDAGVLRFKSLFLGISLNRKKRGKIFSAQKKLTEKRNPAV
jgi:hypothetical protein